MNNSVKKEQVTNFKSVWISQTERILKIKIISNFWERVNEWFWWFYASLIRETRMKDWKAWVTLRSESFSIKNQSSRRTFSFKQVRNAFYRFIEKEIKFWLPTGNAINNVYETVQCRNLSLFRKSKIPRKSFSVIIANCLNFSSSIFLKANFPRKDEEETSILPRKWFWILSTSNIEFWNFMPKIKKTFLTSWQIEKERETSSWLFMMSSTYICRYWNSIFVLRE